MEVPMNIELVKQRILNRKFLSLLLAILVLIGLIFYLRYFFTIGVFYDDTFLKKQGEYPDIQFIGKTNQGSVQISVNVLNGKQNSIDVTFRLPNDINKQYNVSFKDLAGWGLKNIIVKDYNGNVIFEGQYSEDSPFLFDKYGKPLVGNEISRVIVNGETNYNDNYKISAKKVVDFAAMADETIRGKLGHLILAILIFVLTLIDIKYPLLFFNLKYMFSVKDPEPSEFYISMQQISWIVMPIIGLILLIVAVI